MFEGSYPQLMAEYNRWMNSRLYPICAALSDEQRKRDLGAFFKSVHGTLEHILWGDRVWLGRFNGKSYPGGKIGESLYEDFGELSAARVHMDNEIVQWAAGADSAWLAEPMTWTSKLYGFTQSQPRWVLTVQMFNHQTHHRGQVTTLLKQLGVDPGVTDLPLMPLLGRVVQI